jgi:hypothetical protein
VLGAAIAAALSLRYAPVLGQLLPAGAVWGVLILVWVTLLVPLGVLVAPPLWRRWRG